MTGSRSLPAVSFLPFLSRPAATLMMLCLVSVSVIAEEVPSVLDDGMPGKLINIGTHKLHLLCEGEGEPVVMIDSGLGGFSLEWQNIQQELAQTTRVCTYDRAGYGWSEAGPLPRTARVIAGELYRLMNVARLQGPYILVGHSFGGFTIRYFASQYPHMVKGLVLVDASHPLQFARMPKWEKTDTQSETRHKKSWTIRLSQPVLPANYPLARKTQANIMMASYKAQWTRMQELKDFQVSARQVAATQYLPDVPLAVVTRGKRVWPRNTFGDESERVWAELQNDLCSLTSRSSHVIANRSGHFVHLDQPELVISAIRETRERAIITPMLRLVHKP